MTEVIMPKMGDGMEEGTLVEWLKDDGDKVKSGEVIGAIQTDKATLELEAPGSGTLKGILIKAGETVPVGSPIALILKDGESLPENWGKGGAAPAPKTDAPAASAETPVAEVAVAQEAVAEPVGRIKISPLARRMADELGVDVRTLKGTGPGGRIIERDVKAVAAVVAVAPVVPPTKPAPVAPIAPQAEDQVVQLNRVRQITAKRTTESKQQVPHFYVTVEVDVEKILGLRKMFEEEQSGKVSINDFVVKATALALRDMPGVNSAFQGTTVLQFGGVHVGMAVAIDGGLTVPVIKNADQLSLRQISAKSKELAGKARDNKLGLDELTGTTFSISNMGMLDVDNFIAIINQPAAGILAISSVRKKVVPSDDEETVEIRSRMNITCSFDHRVVDGAVGAKFINVVKTYLENPTRLLG